jgi:hypothetical protein
VNTTTSSTGLVSIDRSQLLLRTVDVDRLIDEEHPARAIWELVGWLDLGFYHAEIASVEGRAGRELARRTPGDKTRDKTRGQTGRSQSHWSVTKSRPVFASLMRSWVLKRR